MKSFSTDNGGNVKKELFSLLSESVTETEEAGKKLAVHLKKGDFVALSGDLGAGKTAFVRGMASIISPRSTVKSPTYTIVNTYRTGKLPLYHFDMYRIKSEDDLESVGFYDYDNGIIAAEWPEKTVFALPESYYSVSISGSGDSARSITVYIVCPKE